MEKNMPRVQIDKNKCTGCGKCIPDCTCSNLKLDGGKAEFINADCIACGHCVAICPADAVSVPSFDMDGVLELSGLNTHVDPETLLNAIRARRSVRQYQERKIEREKLESVVEAGRYTATAVNLQGNRFAVIQDRLNELKKVIWDDIEKVVGSGAPEALPLKRLADMRRDEGTDYLFRDAPACILNTTKNLWDAGMAAQSMELEAVSLGLGVLHNGYLTAAVNLSQNARDWLGFAKGTKTSTTMLIGYPSVKYLRTAPRKAANVTWR
jgi:ferredoxin